MKQAVDPMAPLSGRSVQEPGELAGAASAAAPKPMLPPPSGRRGWPLTWRLFLLAAIALLPAILLQAYNEYDLRRSRTAEVHELALRQAELAASELRQLFNGIENLLLAIGAVRSVRAFDTPECTAFLATLQPQMPHLLTIAALDLEGRVRCRQTPGPPELRFADRNYFKEALEDGRFVIGTYTEGRVIGRPVLPLAMPLRADDGAVIGVLAVALDLRWLSAYLHDRALPTGGNVTVADRDGVILAREPLPERFVGTRIPDNFLYLVRASQPGTTEVVSQDGTRRILGYVPVLAPPRNIYVSSGLSTEATLAVIDRATTRGIALIGLGLLVAFSAAYLAGRRFVQAPVAALIAAAERWRAGDYRSPTGLAGQNDEFGALAAAFDRAVDEVATRERELKRAADELREGERRQQLLLRELSHRVKNTLATVQTIAQRSLTPDRSLVEARELLVRRLAALSKTHDLLTATAWRGVGLRALVAAELEPYGERIDYVGQDLFLAPRAAQTLGLILHELATNAAKHGALAIPSGRVVVDWHIVQREDVPHLALRWAERDGPMVHPPTRRGFGLTLLERVVAHELLGRARVDFHPEGLVYVLEAPQRELEAAGTFDQEP